MLNQVRDEITALIPGDIVQLHGRTVVVSAEPSPTSLAYRGETHKVVEIDGWDVKGMVAVRMLAVPDQHVTIIR